jgi:ATP-binding cassette, subfamily B, bacterial
VLSRLTTDTTLVQTVVGSSLSMGLRNAVMGTGRAGDAGVDHPYVMLQVLLVCWWCCPAVWFGRRVRKLSRASQDRVADSSAIATEVLNAMPRCRATPPKTARRSALPTLHRTAPLPWPCGAAGRARLVAFIIISTRRCCCGACTRARRRCWRAHHAGQLGQTVVYIIILAGAVAVLGEVYGDLLRAAGASERLMELLAHGRRCSRPAQPVPCPWPRAAARAL